MTTEAMAVKRRAPRKSSFDNAERERLRATLLGYMEQHRIGVPTLQVRIADASDRSPQLIPLKTLQRFLAAAGRTNDAFLVPCFEFATSLGQPEAPGFEQLAQQLSGFFGLAAEGAKPAGFARFAGSYEARAGKWAPTQFRAVRTEGVLQELVHPYARCIIEEAGNGGLKVREEVFNPARSPSVTPGNEGMRHSYEGVLLFFDPLIFLLSKNTLTRLPRAYWLKEAPNETLSGRGIEALFPQDQKGFHPQMQPVSIEFARSTRSPGQ